MWEQLVASAAGPVLGGLFGSSSAKKAAKQQESSAREGLAAQREMYDIGRQDLSPYRTTGNAANAKLSYLLGIEGGENPAVTEAQRAYNDAQARYSAASSGGSPPTGPNGSRGIYRMGERLHWDIRGDPEWNGSKSSFPELSSSDVYNLLNSERGGSADRSELDAAKAALDAAKAQPWKPGSDYGSLLNKFTGQDLYDDPGYQFRLDEGRKGIENSAAARGMQLSGANLKGLNRYSQDYASNEFGQARNRFMGDQDQTYNYLTGPTQRGMASAAQSASMAQGFGNQQSNTLQGIGNARSAGTVASGNALQSGINGAYNNWNDNQQSQRLNALLRGNSGGGPTNTAMSYMPKSRSNGYNFGWT